MPGYNCNYYKNGLAPCHTKQFFKEHAILSIHSLILTKVLLFMHKIHNFGQGLPSAVINTISADAPKYGNTNELCTEWFANHSTQKMRNALFLKVHFFTSNTFLKFFKIEITILIYHSKLGSGHLCSTFNLRVGQTYGRVWTCPYITARGCLGSTGKVSIII